MGRALPRRWSVFDILQLRSLRESGIRPTEIARLTNRTYGAVLFQCSKHKIRGPDGPARPPKPIRDIRAASAVFAQLSVGGCAHHG